MTTSPEPLSVRFDEYSFWVDLDDGRTLGIPLAWFPRLLHATPPPQRQSVELSRAGLHWEELDEDISVAGLLAGKGDMTRARTKPAKGRAQAPAYSVSESQKGQLIETRSTLYFDAQPSMPLTSDRMLSLSKSRRRSELRNLAL